MWHLQGFAPDDAGLEEALERLETHIQQLPSYLRSLSEQELKHKPAPGKWSKQEILGHLIDSACNNQQKFVRTRAQAHLDFVGYQQDFWVESQKYNATDWSGLIEFWRAYNLHLAHVIEHTDAALLANSITIDDHGTFTLEFIMEDYVEHLKHHLLQILPDGPFSNNFANIYNT